MSIFGIFNKKTPKTQPVPMVLNTEFGQFVMSDSQKEKCYEREIKWGSEEVTVSLYCDSDEVLTANNALNYFRNIMKNRQEWDSRLKQAIVDDVKEPNGMIEIWGSSNAKEMPAPVTTEEFCRRISLGFMHVYPDGDFYFDYDLGDMFTDHGYGVSANASGEIEAEGLQG